MEDSKRKQVLTVVIIACLVLAGLITYVTSRSGNPGLEAFKGQTQWVKCANQNCGAVYELDKKKYLELIQEEARKNVDATGPLPITCEKCGELSVFRAVKCEKCGEVFFYGIMNYRIKMAPVVHSSSAHVLVVQRKSERFHQMQRRVGVHTKSADISAVLRDRRSDQNYIEFRHLFYARLLVFDQSKSSYVPQLRDFLLRSPSYGGHDGGAC